MSKCNHEHKICNVSILRAKMKDLYYNALERELRVMLLFFCNILHHFPGSTPDETATEHIGLTNFSRILKLWTGGQSLNSKGFDRQSFVKRIETRVKTQKATADTNYQRARALFAAMGFLNINTIHHHTNQWSSSTKEDLPALLQTSEPDRLPQRYEVPRCSRCTELICSSFFYECGSGCLIPVQIPNPVGTRATSSGAITTQLPGPNDEEKTTPRYCPICVSDVDFRKFCSRDHIVRNVFPRPCDRNLIRFCRAAQILDQTRFSKTPKERGAKLAMKIGKLVEQGVSMGVRPLDDGMKRLAAVVAPAGPFHVSVTLGPLSVENGLAKTHGGALITSRVLPSLLHDDFSDAVLYNDEGTASSETKDTACLVVYHDHDSGKRSYFEECFTFTGPIRDLLAVVTRVNGGLFCGYRAEWAEQEDAVIRAFLKEADSFHRVPSSKPKRTIRRALHDAAYRVRKLLEALIDAELNHYINTLADNLLDEKLELKFAMPSNTCQAFVDRLLQRGRRFERLFPPVPTSYCSAVPGTPIPDTTNQPRYLVCFSDSTDGVVNSGAKDNSIVSAFSREVRDKSDLVDFAERPESSFGLAELLGEAIEEFARPLRNIVEAEMRLLQMLSLKGIPTTILDAQKQLYIGQQWRNSRSVGCAFVSDNVLLRDLEGEIESGGRGTLSAFDYEVLWAAPRDVMSIFYTHLMRRAQKYSNLEGHTLDLMSWLRNRIKLLRQIEMFDLLAGAFGNEVLETIIRAPAVSRSIDMPYARVYGSAHVDDVIKKASVTINGAGMLVLIRGQIGRLIDERKRKPKHSDAVWRVLGSTRSGRLKLRSSRLFVKTSATILKKLLDMVTTSISHLMPFAGTPLSLIPIVLKGKWFVIELAENLSIFYKTKSRDLIE